MSHRVVQKIWEIRIGAKIELDTHGQYVNGDWVATPPAIAELLGRECGCLRVRMGPVDRLVPEDWYTCTLMISPDGQAAADHYRQMLIEQGISNANVQTWINRFLATWSLCEKHYGIDTEGSTPSDRRREVAFGILKGDPVALDLASDCLR